MSTINEYLASARSRIDRVLPDYLDDEIEAGALVVDIRPESDREQFGDLEGAVAIDRNVLEWRLSPSSEDRTHDVEDRRVILFCNDGYASSLAAASLRDVGVKNAADLVGGFNAYREHKERP